MLLILVPSMELLQHTVPGVATTCKEPRDGDEYRHHLISGPVSEIQNIRFLAQPSDFCVMLMYYLADMNGVSVGSDLSYIHKCSTCYSNKLLMLLGYCRIAFCAHLPFHLQLSLLCLETRPPSVTIIFLFEY
jgi:hypothetical protein